MNISKNNISVNCVNFSSQEKSLEKNSVPKEVETQKDGKKLLTASAMALSVLGSALVVVLQGKIKPTFLKKAGKETVGELVDILPKKADDIANAVEVKFNKKDKTSDCIVVEEEKEFLTETVDVPSGQVQEVAEEQVDEVVETSADIINHDDLDILSSLDTTKSAQERLMDAKAIFFEIKRPTLPTQEERFKIMKEKGISESVIRRRNLDSEERFLSVLWYETSTYKKLALEAKLETFTENDLLRFEKAKSILQKNGIDYDELDVANELSDLILLPEHLVFDNGCVFAHPTAYAYNHELREYPDDELAGGIMQQILDKGLENVEPLKEEITVYRGITAQDHLPKNKKFVQDVINAKKGEIFSDAGFAYSSYDPSVAKTFATYGTILEIKVPKGAKVSTAKNSSQKEVLFPRKSQFRILEETKEKDGYLHTVVEYVLPEKEV